MPDSTIYAKGSGAADDAVVFQGDSLTDWATARGTSLTAGVLHRDSNSSYPGAIYTRFSVNPRSGADEWGNRRLYMGFDVKSEFGTVESATVKVHMDNLGDTGTHARVVMVEAATLEGSTADYGNCFSSGTTLGTLLASYVEVSTTAGYHDFELNGDGISALNAKIGEGQFQVCFMSNYFDYDNNDPDDGGNNTTQISVRFTEYSGTGSDPKIEIDYESGVGGESTGNAVIFGSNF